MDNPNQTRPRENPEWTIKDKVCTRQHAIGILQDTPPATGIIVIGPDCQIKKQVLSAIFDGLTPVFCDDYALATPEKLIYQLQREHERSIIELQPSEASQSEEATARLRQAGASCVLGIHIKPQISSLTDPTAISDCQLLEQTSPTIDGLPFPIVVAEH